LAGATFWLALGFAVLWLLRRFSGTGEPALGWMQLFTGLALIGFAIALTLRLARKRLLWSLRNQLILTYLLVGLAPVVLVATLVAISAYVAAGQFSIHLADSRMRQELDEMGLNNVQRAERMERMLRARQEGTMGPPPPRRPPSPQRRRPIPEQTPAQNATASPQPTADEAAAAESATEIAEATTTTEALPDRLRARLHPHTSVYINGAPPPTLPGLPLDVGPRPAPVRTPLGLPPWATDRHGKEFRGLVLDGDDFYLVAMDQRRVEGAGIITVITSLPVDSALIDVIAEGLGKVNLLTTGVPTRAATSAAGKPNGIREVSSGRAAGWENRGSSVFGGNEPVSVNICDFRVHFFSTLDTVDWETGPDQPAAAPIAIEVHSRPSLLYRQLFGSSLHGVVTSYIRYGLIGLCIIFALIEALALWMALRLGRTITMSVEELYSATQRIDRGDLVHRIPARAGRQDQLGELALSFNRMTGSLERLLIEQHEKERLQSELAIAQEVQANLFPHDVRDLPTLQLHGICRPARSVSGDYYDFLIFRHPDHPDGSPGSESGVGIALGDISGKGISAALLMATLHSAVRAYLLASEDLVYSESLSEGSTAPPTQGYAGDGGKLFESPGRILAMLNRHLYRSTQPEKYATLFLAHYEIATARLTYSNAGHLPPLVLGRDGKVRRLDCGGTVVGLIDDMHYEEDGFQMKAGDILVAYSDGITEPENDFGEFGEARLMEVVARYRDQPLEVISNQVMLALDAWIGAVEQPDDITLVLARQI
jgi:sigma-B regulation protein RsbU (phosphoserine phosphatase)